ncbi:MAG TPA: hypothetical protein VMG41_12445, partial [Gemmatimonadales bacterium]|nr:hypothetical protein [Gemmatimonadales bacterium]
CRACHGSDRKGLPPLPKVTLGKAGFFFKVSEAECTACHVDPHRGRFEAGGAVPVPGGCRACHDTRGFRPSAVDVAAHSHFAFPLEGAHRATPCGECHQEIKGAPGPRRSSLIRAAASSSSELRFDTKRGCADCHQSPHGSQFDHRKDHGRCEGCHDVVAFSPASRFDHDRDALFSLKGAHEHVPCTQCHQVDSRGGATKMVIYQPLSTKCESCHGRNSK